MLVEPVQSVGLWMRGVKGEVRVTEEENKAQNPVKSYF